MEQENKELPSIDLILPELEFKTARSGGPGGQNVNKVATKVEVRFHSASSRILDQEQKDLLVKNIGSKLTTEGFLIVAAQEGRSQLINKELALEKFLVLLHQALRKPKKRKPTKPSAGAKQERLEMKKRNSEKKANRGPLPDQI